MLQFYIEAFKFVWSWIKKFLLAITVLLPGIIFLIYMFAANMPDVGIIPGLLVIAAIALWAPIPLRPFFFQGQKLIGCYVTMFGAIGIAIAFCLVLFGWLVWLLLPILTGLVISAVLNREPKPLECVGTIVFNIVWGPGAHYVYQKLLDKVIK